ncbi:LysR family transcriptional regulator protein (plasmid) [Rhizobium sp. Kim5]|nr:LysR family transcriptional regulator protein [Rhizobium sp. Kim5]
MNSDRNSSLYLTDMAARFPSLSALRVFESAARHLNFGRAGDELFVTHSAVSKQIRLLEEDLGVALFERRNRAVFLTDPGRRLLVTMSEVFRQISDCCEEIKGGGSAPLVLSCEPTFTQRWLIPRLPQFNALHPDIEVHVLAAGGPVSFDRSHIWRSGETILAGRRTCLWKRWSKNVSAPYARQAYWHLAAMTSSPYLAFIRLRVEMPGHDISRTTRSKIRIHPAARCSNTFI